MQKLIYVVIFILLSCSITAQITLEQNVIGSSGSYDSTSSFKVSSTIGETIVTNETVSPYSIAQGFQQSFKNSDISFVLNITSPLCQGRANGFASIDSIVGCTAPYSIIWSNGDEGITANNLDAGNYSVQVISADNCIELTTFSVEYKNDIPCLLNFYSGITPNGDGLNDKWVIDNLELFPQNKIDIYNRLGNRVWETSNYNNENNFWSGENLSGSPLSSGTYFYVFTSGSDVEKGWIELTR